MWLTTTLGESWTELAQRLDARDALTSWREREPDLAGVARAGDLMRLTAAGADPARSDAVMGALVRLAAADGGDQPDALLVVLHLLRPGLTGIRHRLLAAGVPDADALVLGQAVVQVRSFPWRRRTRAHAANLVRDTAKFLGRELAPAWAGREVLVDPQGYDLVLDNGSGLIGEAEELGPEDLAGLLAWAERTAAVDAEELALLLDYVALRERHGSAHAAVAAERGISVRTSKRRCASALASLRDSAPRYLAA
jgi:hypothetical protein